MRCRASLHTITLIAAGCLTAGCGDGGQKAVSQNPEPVTPAAAASWENPTDEECRQFAEALEQAITDGDAEAFDRAIDWDAIFDRATGGIDGVDAARRKWISEVKKETEAHGSLGRVIVANAANGGSYELLRICTRDEKKRALFRQTGPTNTGVTYHDLRLVRQPDGKVRAVEIYIYLWGETMAKGLRRAFLMAVGRQPKEIRVTLPRSKKEYVRCLENVNRMGIAARESQYREALEIYSTLPESMQKDKNLLTVRLQAAQSLCRTDPDYGQQEYLTTIETFRREYPDDACIDILSIGFYITKREYGEAMACAERIDEAVGGDPYIDVLRATISLAEKDIPKARSFARRAIEKDDDLIQAYWCMLDISLEEQDLDETVNWMRVLQDKFGAKFRNLTILPKYDELIKSPQYRQWLQSQPQEPDE